MLVLTLAAVVAWESQSQGAPARAKGGAGAAEAKASPTPSPAPTPAPAFLDATAPTLRVTRDPSGAIRGRMFVLVSNMGQAPFEGRLKAVLRTARGGRIEPVTIPCRIASGEPAQEVAVDLDLSTVAPEDYPLSGWLVFLSGASDKGVVKLEIKAPAGALGDGDWRLIRRASMVAAASMILAAILSIVPFKKAPARGDWAAGIKRLIGRMGSPKWDFTQSWSSTLTVAGAALTSLFSYVGLPEHGHRFSKASYALLSLLFAALIALAPAVYNLVRVPVQLKRTDETADIQYQGFVLPFFLAGVLTMTGVLAQVGLLRAALGDLGDASLLSTAAADALRRFLLALQCGLVVYAVMSAREAIVKQSAAADETQGAKLKAKGAFAAGDATYKAALPDWPLL